MNSKLAIALFTCSIIANSSVFAMDPDANEGNSSSVPVKDPGKNRYGNDKFLKSVNDSLRREVEDEMRMEKLKQDLNTKRLELGFSAI